MSHQNHYFDIYIAQQYGIPEAVILNHIYYCCNHNRANRQNYHDGYFWTYNSIKAYELLFPYLSVKQIRGALNHLIEEEIIITGNYNKSSYDRTRWYALTPKGYILCQGEYEEIDEDINEPDIEEEQEEDTDLFKGQMEDDKRETSMCPKGQMEGDKRETSMCPKGQMDLPQRANGFAPEGEPIPLYNINIHNNISSSNEDDCQPSGRRTVVSEVIKKWNELEKYGIAKITNIGPDTNRGKMLKARVSQYGLEHVIETIDKIKDCDYLLGRVKEFVITFDWFIKPNNYIKVAEGNYLNSNRGIGNKPLVNASPYEDMDELEKKLLSN